MNEQIIAKRIKELRSSLTLTQSDFGQLINVAQTTLSSYEKGTKTPNIETLYNISKKCNISLDWLCGLSDIKTTANFTSYDDIFKLLINICKSIKIDLEKYYNSNYEGDYNMSLIARNKVLDEFLEKWSKIKSIYDDNTIDEDTYKIIIKSIIDKYRTSSLDENILENTDSLWDYDEL